MNKLFKHAMLCMVATVVMFVSSCVDNDFDWDDINKNGVFEIPPVPIGDIDTIWMNVLPPVTIPPLGIEIPQGFETEARKEVVEGLFTKDILDKFFNEKAKKDVKLESVADINILGENSGLEVKVKVEVVDANGDVIPQVVIPTQTLYYGTEQDFDIVFPVESFKYMKNARDLNLIFVIKANSIRITDNDYAYIKNIVLKSGGLHFEF